MRSVMSFVLGFVAACSRAPASTGPMEVAEVAGEEGGKIARPVLDIVPGAISPRHVPDLSAEELVQLVERADGSSELTEEERAVLAEYDGVLAAIARAAEAPIPDADPDRAYLVTRDYELWITPGPGAERYTVKDRAGKVLAERVGEERLRRDFSYLHNLLHPEYKQFYDVVDR